MPYFAITYFKQKSVEIFNAFRVGYLIFPKPRKLTDFRDFILPFTDIQFFVKFLFARRYDKKFLLGIDAFCRQQTANRGCQSVQTNDDNYSKNRKSQHSEKAFPCNQRNRRCNGKHCKQYYR